MVVRQFCSTLEGGVADIFRALVPVGTVEAVRQKHEVFRTAGGDYLVISPSSRGSSSFHMASFSSARVETLAMAVRKEGATTGALMKDPRLDRPMERKTRSQSSLTS